MWKMISRFLLFAVCFSPVASLRMSSSFSSDKIPNIVWVTGEWDFDSNKLNEIEGDIQPELGKFQGNTKAGRHFRSLANSQAFQKLARKHLDWQAFQKFGKWMPLGSQINELTPVEEEVGSSGKAGAALRSLEEHPRQNSEDPKSWRTAHCIVGQARSFISKCVVQSIANNFIDAFPGRQTVFVHLSKNNPSVRTKNPVNEQLNSAKIEQAIKQLPNVVSFFESTAQVPECLTQSKKPHEEDMTLSVMWGNVRDCFQRVVQYERKHNFFFDLVTRIRPDTVFFHPFDTQPLQAIMKSGSALFPLGGLLGACENCANDHQAVVPRRAAEQYFLNIANEFTNCSTFDLFIKQYTDVKTSNSVVGAEIRFGPGFGYAKVGLTWKSSPWPYALTARSCVPEPLSTCLAGNLQCKRLFNAGDLRNGSQMEHARNLMQECNNWKCVA